MSRLFVFVVLVSCFIGCSTEPEVEPVRLTPEAMEKMRNMTHADGTPIRGSSVSGRERVQNK